MRYSREAEFKNVCSCFLSQRDFQYGPHIYDGRRVPQWDIMVCKHCHAGNWDGIVIEVASSAGGSSQVARDRDSPQREGLA